jgi:YidC/Oxa1 family membrane protein insertase
MGTIMIWLEAAVSTVLVGFEKAFEFLGLSSTSGVTWALSIVGLVITIRTLLIPLFVRQIKATRAQQLIAPDLRKIQQKYKGKRDQASREAMSRETMALYQKHGTNPFASCLPIILQAPIFFALFRVLRYHLQPIDGVFQGFGPITSDLAKDAYNAQLFGAPISQSFNGAEVSTVKWVAAILIVMMVTTTFLTQRQITRKNMPKAALEGPQAQTAKIMMYAMPFIFVFSGPWFPIGVLIYWTTTNLWSMGQQYYVIRRNPTPGSEAERLFKERQERASDWKTTSRRLSWRKGPGSVSSPNARTENGDRGQDAMSDEQAHTKLDHEGDIAADFLEEFLDILDMDGDIDISVEAGRAKVAIVSPEGPSTDLKRLVGSKGKVLEALQDLTRLAVQTETGEISRLVLDVAEYRAGQRVRIEEMAREVVVKVKANGEPTALTPMNAFERKIVHDVVLAAGLESESEGEEPDRFVVVRPS